MEIESNHVIINKLHACNILVAHGSDPYSGLATMIFIYGINFLILSERRNMTLWIDYTADYNKIYYDPNYNENVFEYYFEGITPESQHCNKNISNYTVLTKHEIWPDMHYNLEWAIHGWYYHWYHHGIDKQKDMNYYYESWYKQQRETGYKYVSKYFKLKQIIKDELEQKWNAFSKFTAHKYIILGLHIRGTDKAAHRRKIRSNEFLVYVSAFMKYFGKNGKIFIATDDTQYLNEFKLNWDKYVNSSLYPIEDTIFMQNDIVRSSNGQAVFRIKDVGKYQIGKEVLFDILMLAKCDWFIHGASMVSEAVFYNNIYLHNHSVHLEYTKNRQIPFWMNSYSNYKCIILHKFHNLTDFAKGQIDLAVKQIKEDGECYYVVLYWIDNRIYTQKQNDDILWLENHRNLDIYNVFIVDVENTEKTFPDFFDFMSRTNYEWLKIETWPWEMADVPELVWYETFENMFDFENVKIWLLEYDVGWKGNLPKLYRVLENDYNDKHSEDCDIMAYDCINKQPKWSHYYKHTDSYKYNNMSVKPEPISCLIQMIRYNPKLMRLMIDEINENKIVYCEMRAVMICQRNTWCKLCDLYRPRNKYFGTFYSGTSFNSKQWNDILNNDSIPISFWHRINTLWTH
eukprot:242014_1